jgi:hypothetical protein
MRIIAYLVAALAAALPSYAQMGTRTLRGYNGHELERNIVLPQLVVGESYTTSVALLNLGDSDHMGSIHRDRLQISGKISFYRQDGTRMPVGVNGGVPTAEFRFALGSPQSSNLELKASGPDTVGWALIEIDDQPGEPRAWLDGREMMRGDWLMVTVFYSLKQGGQTLSRVAAVPSVYEMNRYFSSVLAARYDDDLYTGVAIVNTSAVAAQIALRLRDSDGRIVATVSVPLVAGSQTARFLHELFGGAVQPRFLGTLEISTTSEGVVALGLLVGEGVLTSIPTFHYGNMSRMGR